MLRALAICPVTLSRNHLFSSVTAIHPSVDLALQDPQLQETQAAFAAISSAAERMYQSLDTNVTDVSASAPVSAVTISNTASTMGVSDLGASASEKLAAMATAATAPEVALANQVDPYTPKPVRTARPAEVHVVPRVEFPESAAFADLEYSEPSTVSAAAVAESHAPCAPASQSNSLASIFKLPASRRDIAKAVFRSVNGTANTSGAVGSKGHGAEAVEAAWVDLDTDMDPNFDPQSMAQYAYTMDEEPESQESFARFLRMHFPEESAAVSASVETASTARLPQTMGNNGANGAEVWSAPVPRYLTRERPAARQPLFTLNAQASTSRESIAGILARDFGSIGVGSRKGRANSSSSSSFSSSHSSGKLPASQVYEERLKQLSLAQQSQLQSAPYVEVSSDNISGATKISVNSMAQHLSAHLLPAAMLKDEGVEVSTVVTTSAPTLAQSNVASNVTNANSTENSVVGMESMDSAATATEVVKAVTAHATAQEQAQVKALASSADPLTDALDQALLQPMSTKVAILDAVATAPQRLHPHTVSQDSLQSSLGRSVMYAAAECGRDPVLSSVSPQVAAAVAAIASEERALEQKAAEASSTLVNSITSQGHTIVTGRIAVPLDEVESSVAEAGADGACVAGAVGAKSSSSDLRIVRHQGKQAFVPSMEGVVSTDMSRRVQAHGALAAVGLRSSLNEAAATALGLDVSSSVLYGAATNSALGMVNGTSEVNGTRLNARAMRSSLSPLAAEHRAVSGALEFAQPLGVESAVMYAQAPLNNALGVASANNVVTITAPNRVREGQDGSPTASWMRSWQLNKEMEQSAHASDFSTATSRAALAAMQSAEALASLQDSLNLVAAPDLIHNEVLVRNTSTRIVTNSQRAKDYFTYGARIVEGELARKRMEQETQAQQPSTVISQYDVLLPATRDLPSPSPSPSSSPSEQVKVQETQAPALESSAPLPAEAMPTATATVVPEQTVAPSAPLASASALESASALKPAPAITARKTKAKASTKVKASESMLMSPEELPQEEGEQVGAQAAPKAVAASNKPKSRTRVVVTTRKARRAGTTRSSSKTI